MTKIINNVTNVKTVNYTVVETEKDIFQLFANHGLDFNPNGEEEEGETEKEINPPGNEEDVSKMLKERGIDWITPKEVLIEKLMADKQGFLTTFDWLDKITNELYKNYLLWNRKGMKKRLTRLQRSKLYPIMHELHNLYKKPVKHSISSDGVDYESLILKRQENDERYW